HLGRPLGIRTRDDHPVAEACSHADLTLIDPPRDLPTRGRSVARRTGRSGRATHETGRHSSGAPPHSLSSPSVADGDRIEGRSRGLSERGRGPPRPPPPASRPPSSPWSARGWRSTRRWPPPSA